MSEPIRIDDFVRDLMDEGPEAIATAIHQRDLIIAKLMHKLGLVEISLHSENDPPDVRIPFGCEWIVDAEADSKLLTVKIHKPRGH